MLTVLKSKIRELRVNVCNKDSEDNITIPWGIMHRANIYPYERVEVNSKFGKGRIVTYAIPGDRVELNGGAANHFKKGDIVHVNCFKTITESLAHVHKPIIV